MEKEDGFFLSPHNTSDEKTKMDVRYSNECVEIKMEEELEEEVAVLPENGDITEIVEPVGNVLSMNPFADSGFVTNTVAHPSTSSAALESPFHVIKLPSLLDGELFEVCTAENGGYMIVCKSCPGRKTIRGTMSSTGNYISHIKRMHPSLVQRMEEKRKHAEHRHSRKRMCRSLPATFLNNKSEVCLSHETKNIIMPNMSLDRYVITKAMEPKPHLRKIPRLLDGELYEVCFADNGDYIIVCKNCPGKKTICGTMSSTGNYISHIKRVHPELIQRMEEKRMEEKKKADNRKSEDQTQAKGKKGATSPNGFGSKGRISVSKKEALEAISEYVINEMLPISTVERPSFRKMVATLAKANPVPISAPDGSAFILSLEKQMQQMLCNIKKVFELQQYICTTADIWSLGNRSFLGMTGHFIDKVTFERRSFALACSRMKFQHTYDNIAEAVHAVHEQFGIVGKVTHTVTDNTTNFGMAFKHYMWPEPGSDYATEEHDHFDDIDIVEINLAADPMSDMNVYISLPPQLCCCSHLLNLVATRDIDASEAIHSADAIGYRKFLRASFLKLSAFWNLLNCSTQATDYCEKICKRRLPVPTRTRWNSFYDAIKSLIAEKSFLDELFSTLKLPNLKSVELEFLEEYVQVMQPLANGVDILQGEQHCYMGTILPTLLSILKRIENIDNLKHCRLLKQMILAGLEKRFHKTLNISSEESSEFVLASISHPRFKMTWVPEEHVDKTRSLFMAACELVQKSAAIQPGESAESTDLDFFSVLDAKNNCEEVRSAINTACLEALHYLEDNDRSLSVLHKYPTVRAVFMKHNTSIPSSAPVEKFFSAGGQLLTPQKNKVSNKHFEMLLLLRSNSNMIKL